MIKHIIYHILHKEQHDIGEVGESPNELSPSDEDTTHLLDALKKAYRERAGKGYGYFDEGFALPPVLTNHLKNPDCFYDTTLEMMNILKTEINRQALATGGKVFIADYEEESVNYLLIAILSEKTSYIANDWAINRNQSLDIDHLKFAGRINLTAWQNGEARYISFLKGQGEVSGYFKLFLACNDVLIAQAETKKLVELLEDFANEQGLDLDDKAEFFHLAQEYLYDINENQEPFELETFANRVWSQEPQVLKDKLADEDDGVSDGFIPDKRSIKKLSTFTGKTKHWRLSFDRTAIADGQIRVDNGRIIINNPPEKLLEVF